jgi:hypothetical protein
MSAHNVDYEEEAKRYQFWGWLNHLRYTNHYGTKIHSDETVCIDEYVGLVTAGF